MIFIAGGSGLVGRTLCKKFKDLNIKHIGSYESTYYDNLIKLNFFSREEIELQFEKLNVTYCINCIVQRIVDRCENDWSNTKKINIDLVTNLAFVCKKLNIHLIHFSTDYVFSGKNAPYFPDSETCPLQNYGISKLISEKKVIENCDIYTIIRVPVLYSDNLKNFNENAVTMMGKKVINALCQYSEDNFCLRRPLFIEDIFYFIIKIINEKIFGIVHFFNPYDKVTKCQMIKLIGDYLNKQTNNITAINFLPDDGVERPYDTELKDLTYDIRDLNVTRLKIGLEKCFEKLYHPKLELSNLNNYDDIFLLIDLDGTLVDTDLIHYKCYKEILSKYNINFLYDEFLLLIDENKIDTYLHNNFNEQEFNEIKVIKGKMMNQIKEVKLIYNANLLLEFIKKFNINHCIVTNTSSPTVEQFKKVNSKLLGLNFIAREDYNEKKPSPESYNVALKKYYKNEKYIIGFENTHAGYLALKSITSIIYILTTKNNIAYEKLKDEDVYLCDNYNFIIFS